MSISASSGPIISFGQAPYADYNAEAGPSLFYNGAGILDPRSPWTYEPGQSFSNVTAGFLGFTDIRTMNVIPFTKATSAVVASANATAATLVLVSAASATTGVAIVPSITRADTGVVDTNGGAGFVALDAYTSFTASITGTVMTVTANSVAPITIGMTLLTAGGTGTLSSGVTVVGYGTGTGISTGTYIVSQSQTIGSGTITAAINSIPACLTPFGSAGTVQLWNPQTLIGRALAVTAANSATATTATISGYDIYGYPMVENITLSAGSAVNGKKAFKYIKSVVLNAADATHAYSVDTTDIIGFPIRSDNFGDVLLNYSASVNPAVITANTGYVAAVQTTPSATTGDVRGTYALQTAASTGANRLVVSQSPAVYNIGSTSGLFGVTQFSTF